jgi:hypothetical protein
MRKQEESLQITVSTYLKFQYPDVYFTYDSSGDYHAGWKGKVNTKKKHSKHKQLDMIILEPRGGFHGLVLELKKDRDEAYTKEGLYRKEDHLQNQLNSINILRSKGYASHLLCGFDEAKMIIDLYMNLKPCQR